MNNYFLLYACCIPVKGYKRSVIIDTQRQAVHFIPNSLYQILTAFKEKKCSWIKNYCKDTTTIDEYYDFLISKELGCFVESIKPFPPIDLLYTSPYQITNAIIVSEKSSNHDYLRIFSELNSADCQAIELRSLDKISLENLISILESENTLETGIKAITTILPYIEGREKEIENLNLRYPKVKCMYIYNCPSCRTTTSKQTTIIYSDQTNISRHNCGRTSIKNFSPNLKMVIESINKNNCLNQKVCIDSNGAIKNCPSMEQTFGNIYQDTLAEVISNKQFTQYWNLNKDLIEVCKDCEFRYICIDCRAYRSLPDNLRSSPTKCSYDPYNAKWKDKDKYE